MKAPGIVFWSMLATVNVLLIVDATQFQARIGPAFILCLCFCAMCRSSGE